MAPTAKIYFGAGGMAQVVENLSSRLKALSSSPNTNKKELYFSNCYWKVIFLATMPIHK
jgi:hypothetical protein